VASYRRATLVEIDAAVEVWIAAKGTRQAPEHPARLRSWVRLPGVEVGAPVRTVRFRPRRIAQVIAGCTVPCEQRCAGRGEASDVSESRLPDLDLVHLANDKEAEAINYFAVAGLAVAVPGVTV
jgi:hypothetical protein